MRITNVGAQAWVTKNGPCGQGPTLRGQDQSTKKWQESKDQRSGEPYCVRPRLGPILTNKLEGQIQVGNRALSMPLGNSLPNTIWRLEQVPRESLKGMMIPWNSCGSGNACEVVKW